MKRCWLATFPLLLLGCTLPASDSSGDGGTAGGGGSGGEGGGLVTTAAPLVCLDVLRCVVDCPDADAGCPDACNAKGDAATQALVIAFTDCLVGNSCADAACVQAHCLDALRACANDLPPSAGAGGSGGGAGSGGAGGAGGAAGSGGTAGAAGSGGAPSGGAIPAELVGQWSRGGTSSGGWYTFAADGTTDAGTLYENDYACHTKVATTSDGTTTIDGAALTYHRASGVYDGVVCGGVPEHRTTGAADFTFAWSLATDDAGPLLTLSDLDGQNAQVYRRQ